MKMICKVFYFSYGKKNIINNITLEINSGQVLSIVGPNGAGKSTLIKCLCHIYKPDKGEIYIDNKKISSFKNSELTKIIGYVPQNQTETFSISVFEAVLLGRKPYLKWKVSKKDIKIVESILKKLNMLSFADRDMNTLSGGERQKVAIARALAQNPEILFLDEPTSNLDMYHQLEVMNMLTELTHNDQKAVVVIMHDLNLASRYSDYIFLMGENGNKVQGIPETVLTPENIKQIYNVEVEILNLRKGFYMIPNRIA